MTIKWPNSKKRMVSCPVLKKDEFSKENSMEIQASENDKVINKGGQGREYY